MYTRCVPDSTGNYGPLMCYKTGMIKRSLVRTVAFAVAVFVSLACSSGEWCEFLNVYAQSGASTNPVVRVDTTLGSFSIELFEQTTPVTVANFLNYVRDGDYDGSFIHRVVPGFVVQGGGFGLNSNGAAIEIPADPPIVNEFNISNTRGTVAMAKLGGNPNSATSQWFVNLGDNSGILDPQNGGFTVFGRVIDDGMAVVDAIAALPLGFFAPPFSETPAINSSGALVVLSSVTLVVTELSATGTVAQDSVAAGSSALLTVTVVPGGNPASSGITVSADLSSIGGSGSQNFFDDGTNGDVTAGDNTFSFLASVPVSASAGTQTISYTVTDGQARTAGSSILLTFTRTIGTELFSITDRGGTSISSQGTAQTPTVGYGRIRPDSGRTTPSGLGIFGFTANGVLVSEAGVPAAAPVQSGRIFAEVNGPVNTGLAIANPNDADATISFFFTDLTGTNSGSGTLTLGANQQTAKFLDQDPFNGVAPVLGTFTFTSSVPISVVALRGFTNERSEFLITTLPVAPLSTASSDTIYFPHFADGLGWTTQVILVNPTDATITGNLQFLGQGIGTTAAEPLTLALDDGSSGSSFAYAILPRTIKRFTTSSPAGAVTVGSVRATPDPGSTSPSGVGVFSLKTGGITVSEAGVPALPVGSAFRVYVEASGTTGQVGSVRSGLAVTDTSGTANTVTLDLTNLDGSSVASAQTLSLPPSGQTARFIDELFSLPANFSGVLRVTSTSAVAIVGLRGRTNQREDFLITTTPPSSEVGATTSVDTFFPHLADSGGWSTQFVLFSGTAGQTSSGTLSFIDQAGQVLDLSVTSSSVTSGNNQGSAQE